MRYVRIPFDPSSWGTVVDSYPSAEVYHSPEWLAFLKVTKGIEPVVAEIRTEADDAVGHFVGGITRLLGLRILGSPLSGWGTNVMGFLLRPEVDRREAAIALLEFAYRELGCVHVEVRDRISDVTGIHDSPYSVTTRETLVVDLNGSEDDAIGRMHSRTRTYVRRAPRIGLVIEEATDPGFADEYNAQLVDVFGSKALVPTYGMDRIRSLIEIVGPSGQLSTIRLQSPGGEPVGSIVTVGRNARAALWGLAWYRSAAEFHPVEALQWAAMRYWRAQGAVAYDLDGTGLAKEKFGGSVQTELHLHHSRHAVFDRGRDAIRTLFYSQQRARGRLRSLRPKRERSD
jgi:hypothetical protein